MDRFKNVSRDSLESAYFITLDFTDRLHDNEKINDERYFENVSDIVGVYAPRFSDWCYSIFNQHDWSSRDLSFMNSRISELQNLKINGTSVLANNDRSSLRDITGVISEYNKAKALASSTSFSSVTNAKEKISQAREYANQEYLSNNTSLVNSLNALPSKIEQSHYKNLVAHVQKLQNYGNYSWGAYEALAKNVIKEIDDYSDAANNVYHHSSDIRHLRDLVSDYYDRAYDYFHNYDGSSSSSSSGYEDWY